MTTKTLGSRTADFLRWEGDTSYCRDEVIVTATNAIEPGTVLGKITATGKYVPHDSDASDGSEEAVAILFRGMAAGTEEPRTVVSRLAEVNGFALVYHADATDPEKTAVNAALAAQGIIVR